MIVERPCTVFRFLTMTFSLVIFLAMLHASCGFYPNRFTEFKLTADTYTHEDITEIGILKAVAAYFEDYPRIGSTIMPGDLTDMVNISAQKLFTKYYGADQRGEKLQNVISDIVTKTNDVYKDHFTQADWHFNGEKINEANKHMRSFRDDIIVALNREDDSSDDLAVELIGKFLHIMQMFYSNTNWVEMFGSDAYYDLGITNKTIHAQASNDTVTCRSCGELVGTDCNDTLLVGNSVLTSGYLSRQDVVKPSRDPSRYTTGKCSHGGPSDETGATVAALGGINKDTVLPYLSPHYYLHHRAAQAAINHTTFFFNDKKYGLRYIIGEKKFLRFLQMKSGESLVLTIDYSGSMSNDVAAVKTQIIENIKSRIGTVNEAPDYVIVLFNDPVKLTKTFQTENSQHALEYVENITVSGGGDCPEYSLTGIETALTLCKPYTEMFIFTDAAAKDESKETHVTNIAHDKHVLLTFVLTGDCGSRKRRDVNVQSAKAMTRSRRSTNGEDLYRRLAAATGGSVYVTDKAGISKLADIITETGTLSTVKIFKREVTASSDDIKFNVDNTISLLIMMITGSTLPNEEIYNPMGNRVTSELNVTDLEVGKIIKIKDPSPGVWRLSGLDSGSWLVDVSAVSVLDISTMFVQYDPTTRFEYQIKGRPIAGEKATIIVTVPSASLITSLDFITLLSNDGSVLAQYSNMTRIDSRADTALFRARFELPIEAFKVSVSGRDTGGNPFTRLETKTIAPVAIQLDLLPVNDSLYINETLTVEYTVTNKGDAQTSITVTVEDDKGFAQDPRTHSVTLDPDQSERKQFIFKAGSSTGVVTTVTITAKAGSTGEQFVVTRLATKERVVRAEDNSMPVCTITSRTGSCDETMVDPCVCSQYNWTATAEIWDEGFGLYQITSSIKMFSHGSFPQGYTRDKGTVMANVSGNCCKPNAYITAVDVASNTGQCTFNLAPDVETIPTECIQDLIDPVCNITSMTGICDETMVDPCVCSQYNWTATAEIWDEGFGLYQITSSIKMFSHGSFPQGYTRDKGTVMANVSGNCCKPNAYITAVDVASNTGQCTFNLAPDVETIPTECIQDLIDPVCNITSMTGICDETMVDHCVCSQYNWTATAEIWDEGFGLYQITSSIKMFSHGSFPQGYTRDKGTVMANVSGNCCKPNAYITVVDVASNTGQCTFNLAPDVETIPTECIQDLIDPVCNITSMTGICDETMVDPCVCSQYNWTATAEIWDEGFGLYQITSSIKMFSHGSFPQGYTRDKGTVMANVSGNCCKPNAYITAVDVASNTGQCTFNLAPDVETIPTECIQDLIDPVCNITSMTGICDETMVDPCVCSQYNWTATAEIWDEGFGLKQISSSVKDFSHGSFSQGHTRINGTVVANVFGNCCNPSGNIMVVDLASNSGKCIINLAPDVETILTECIQDLIDPVCNITSMTGICNETMVDPCVCQDYEWEATAAIWDEGFGLSNVSSSVKDKARFIHEPFEQGHNAEDGTLIAKVGGTCCMPAASITVSDLSGNMGQCTFNLAPDVEVTDQDCIPSTNSEDDEMGQKGNALTAIVAVAASAGLAVIGIVLVVICIVCKSRGSK